MNGCTTVSGSSVTVGSIQVVAGSTIVTPASMCASLIRSRRAAAAAASSTRVLTPSVSAGSARDVDDDLSPALDEVAHGVGEVQLALDVRRLQPVERRARAARRGRRRSTSSPRRSRAARATRRPPRRSPRGRRPRRARSARSCGCRRARTRAPSRRPPASGASRASASSSPVVRSGVSPGEDEHLRRRRRARPRRSGRRRPCRAARSCTDRREPVERRRRLGRGDDDQRLGRREAGPPRRPSRPSAGRGSGAGASASRSACACRRPPAMTTAASVGSGLRARWARWLGRQDSNLGSRDQNPLPYRLATPQ